jgi:predicted O-methyltransferase YrrM
VNTITDRLMELDPTLKQYFEGDWDIAMQRGVSRITGEYTSFNDAGVECETGEFLYGMIRVLKPKAVLETGTHVGVGASYMGLALKDNGIGRMDTVEFLPPNYDRAKQRIQAMGLTDIVQMHLMDVAGFGGVGYDFVLLDTEPQTRFKEMLQFVPSLTPGGFIFIHDLNGHMGQVENTNPDHPEKFWPWFELPEQIKTWVANDELRPFHFATPRGLTGFYKPRPSDYVWKK